MLIPVLVISSLVHFYSIGYMSHDPWWGRVKGKHGYGEKLPNSGDLLKFLIPSCNWKVVGGWSNYSGMVTSQKMSENEMDNRGSKSVICENITVKEQRVDGSWRIKQLMRLRCTLMGFERNYLANIPSNQSNIREFYTFSHTNINPWTISGLIDAEGSFSIILDKNKSRKLGWRVQSKFQIGLHLRDIDLLRQIQEYLHGIGSIHSYQDKSRAIYSIDSNQDLFQLINHLDKYPLISQKAADYLLFKQVVELINNKAHLTTQGLNQIVNIKASMNLGLSDVLKSEFVEYKPVERPIIITDNIPHPSWISGFVSGEGNFDVRISPSSTKIGYRVQLRFRISRAQANERDLKLMETILKLFGTGNIYKYNGKSAVSLTIVNFKDITNIIIPFFNENPLVGVKLYDYQDWCKINKLMNEGSHLSLAGLNLIRELKLVMNTGRKLEEE